MRGLGEGREYMQAGAARVTHRPRGQGRDGEPECGDGVDRRENRSSSIGFVTKASAYRPYVSVLSRSSPES